MNATELRRKISKMETKSLINKFEKHLLTEEELPIAVEFLEKRGYKFAEVLSNDLDKLAEALKKTVSSEDLKKITGLPAEEETPVQIAAKPAKPVAEKKAKASGKKKPKKMFTDDKGKQITKSDLMRRLIRANHGLKPKELNEQLQAVGFEKAYHSEIQRCRQQLGVSATK